MTGSALGERARPAEVLWAASLLRPGSDHGDQAGAIDTALIIGLTSDFA